MAPNPRVSRRVARPYLGLLLFLLCLGILCADSSSGSSQTDTGSQALQPNPKLPPPPEAYAGDAACRACHAKQAAPYLATPHHQTSRPPSAGSIKGSFSPGLNLLRTANPDLVFVMNAEKGHFYQSAVDIQDPSHVQAFTEPFDIIVGSGRKGQTYLYWKGDELFELPVSYWTSIHRWVNSPGYPDGQVHFDKAIVPRCLDCHGSYFESQAPPLNRFRKTSLVLGISCEKCHGPGREHVVRERSPHPPRPGSPQEAIVNPAHLPRDRQLDLCSLCHAGPATPIAPTLSYLPGDAVDEFLKIPDPGPDAPVDVHANQVQLLRRSRCFQSSDMNCSTCHNVHTQQRDLVALSARCLICHKVQACGKYAQMGEQIRQKCVECHMPLQRSDVLFAILDGEQLRPLVRTHRIAIYPDAPGSSAENPGVTTAPRPPGY